MANSAGAGAGPCTTVLSASVMAADALPALRRARGPADAGRARLDLPLCGEYVDTDVGPTAVLEDATDMLSLLAGMPGSIGSAGKGPGALESLVDVVIASDEDCSEDPGLVNPVW